MKDAVTKLLRNSNSYWDGKKLDWNKISDAGIVFHVPDSTPKDLADDTYKSIVSVVTDGDDVRVKTTDKSFVFSAAELGL